MHFILCQRSCLVGTDDTYGTKCFHSMQLTDNGIVAAHDLNTQCKYNGNDCRKSLRYGSDSERN